MSLFDEVRNHKTGRYELKANEELFTSHIGIYADMKDVYGFDKLNENEQEYLTFLYRNYNTTTSGFAKKSDLQGMFHTTDRQLRAWNERIHALTHLVVWSSTKYGGTKIASNNDEIDQAIEDRQSHVNGAIRNIMYMSKNRDYDRLHSTVGYYKKQADNKPQGQMFMTFSQDEGGEIKMVNHYPNQSYQNLLPHDERVKAFMKVKHSMREYLSLSKGKPLDMKDVEYRLKLKRLELEINEYLDEQAIAERKDND